MSAGDREVLFESPGLRATFVDAGAPDRPLVVTFDSLNVDLRLERPGFGEAWLAQMGLDGVHVVSTRNAWYQDPATPALLDAVRAFAAGRARVVTYGSSMGGYAAVRFAGRLGAQAAVALSPQFSIDPAVVPWETRWTEYAQGLDFAVEAQAAAAPGPERVYAVYDPAIADRRQVEALCAAHPVVRLPVRHAGHPAGTFLAETGLLSELMLGLIEDRCDPAHFRRAVRDARRRSAAWHSAVAARQPRWRRAAGLRLAQEAVRLIPAPQYLRVLGEQLLLSGAIEEAGVAFRRAWEASPEEPSARLRLAEHLALYGGDPAEVRDLATGLAERGARREWLFVRACDVLFVAGALAAARDEARAAAARLPGSKQLRRRAWALTLAAAAPPAGRWAVRRVRRRLFRTAAGIARVKGWKRLVGATGFEPATP